MDYDKIAKRMEDKLPITYRAAIANLKVNAECTAQMLTDSGIKCMIGEKELEMADIAKSFTIKFESLFQIMITLYDIMHHDKGMKHVHNQMLVEYATNIEQCNDACHNCGLLGVKKYEPHDCKKKGENIYAKWNSDNPLHTAESKEKCCDDNSNTPIRQRPQRGRS